MIRFLLPTLVLCACVPSLEAGDWPEFRGPDGQGHSSETHLPREWDSTKNVAWKVEVPGKGWSTPAVVDGKIFLTTAVPAGSASTKTDYALETLCIDARSGKLLWETKVFEEDGRSAPAIHSKNSHASPSPIVSGKRVYVHFGHQGTACLDLDGKVLWKSREIKYAPVHGNGGSPVLVDEALIFSCDGSDKQLVVALDAASGKVRWQTDRQSTASKKFSFQTPLVIAVNGKKQVVSAASDMVAAYDPADGKEIWRVRYDGYSLIPRAVYGHGRVYLSTGYERPLLLAIRADGKGDVTDTHIVWTAKTGAPQTPSPLLVGAELYSVSDGGVLACYDSATGKLHWSQRLGARFSASPIYADGRIYLLGEGGEGFVLEPGKELPKPRKNEIGELTLASYAAADGALFIRSDKHLFRIELPGS